MRIKPPAMETPLGAMNEAYEEDRIVSQEVDPSVINEILEETEVLPKAAAAANDKLKSYLNNTGGTLEKVAENISNIMNFGDSDAIKLKAAEFVAKLHGVQVQLDEIKEEKQPRRITINIVGSENKSLINFMMPKS